MLTRYMRRISSQDFPAVLSITDTSASDEKGSVIQRNYVRRTQVESDDIYVRARDIYFRARSQRRIVRAASIF